MANSVYGDDDKNRLIPSNGDLPAKKTPKNSGEEGGESDGGDGESSGAAYQPGSLAKGVRDAEIKAGTGQSGASSSPDDKSSGGNNSQSSNDEGSNQGSSAKSAATKSDIKGKEDSAEGGGFFSGEDDKDKGKKTKRKGRLSVKQKVGGTMAIIAIFGGGGISLFAAFQGPLEFIHFAQLMKSANFDPKNGEGEGRLLKALRDVRYISKGERQKTRLSIAGVYVTNIIEGKLSDGGITSEYEKTGRGKFTGYTIDPQKLKGDDFSELKSRDPATVKEYLKTKFNINVEITSDNKLFAGAKSGIFSYRQNRLLLRNTLQIVGLKGTPGAIAARFMGVKAGITWHPVKALDNKILDTVDEKLKAWRERTKTYVKNGSKAPSPVAEVDPGNKKPTAGTDDVPGEIAKIEGEGTAAGEAAAGGDLGPLNAFRTSLTGKLTGGGAAAVGVLCLALFISKHFDTINQAETDFQLARIGASQMALGDQVANGDNSVDQQQLGFIKTTQLYDSKTQTSWSDAQEVHHIAGEPISGPRLPEEMVPSTTGGVVSQFLSAIPGVEKVCQIAGTTVGAGALLILSAVTVGPIGTAIGALAVGALLPIFMDWISKYFSNAVVPPLPAGALLGSVGVTGNLIASDYMMMSQGGGPLTKAQSDTINYAEAEDSNQEFQSKSLAYRLFDTKDPRSLFAQAFDKTAPVAHGDVTRVASGLLNINHTFASILSSPFTGITHADAKNDGFDMRVPDFGYTVQQLDDPTFENPYQNGDAASDILDQNTADHPTQDADNYIFRAKSCFGVDIFKGALDGQAQPGYKLMPPVAGTMPTFAFINDPFNKCNDGSEDWLKVRFYIFDSQVMNGAACYLGDVQACIDIGQEPDPNAGNVSNPVISSTGVPTCATTAVTSAPAGYKLTNCEDFTAPTLTNGWSAYESGGGDTVQGAPRRADHCKLGNDLLTLVQDSTGTCGVSSGGPTWNQLYGYWEVRMRAYEVDPKGPGTKGHPVLLLWPSTGAWSDGEMDYFETDFGDPAHGFLHCPGAHPADNCYTINQNNIDYSQFNNWGLEWQKDHATGYINGTQWWTSSDASWQPKVAMHQTIQLDAPHPAPINPSKMEIDWVHVYAKQ